MDILHKIACTKTALKYMTLDLFEFYLKNDMDLQ